MRVQNNLGKILLLMPLMMLLSCSHGDDDTWPSLAADDLWDQMAEERKKPLPTAENKSQADDSGEQLADQPAVSSSGPLSVQASATSRRTLQEAVAKFKAISAALEAGFQEQVNAGGTEEDRESLWRTMQLHLSRLTNLQKNVIRAVGEFERAANRSAEDQTLLENSRDLLATLAERLASARSRLNEFSPK